MRTAEIAGEDTRRYTEVRRRHRGGEDTRRYTE
jgi:hypothetical protein